MLIILSILCIWPNNTLIAFPTAQNSKTGQVRNSIKKTVQKKQSLASFLDATEQSGINFVHFNGTTGEYLLPEITGAGGALFDYDNDGDLDLYVVQGAELKTTQNPKAVPWRAKTPPRDRLYLNDLGMDGNQEIPFTDVPAKTGIKAFCLAVGAATGDFLNY